MIAEGRFEVRSGRRKKAVYKPGDYFGEMDLLSGEAHTGTVTALENGELMVMGRDEFHFVLQQYEPVRRQFHEVLRIRRPELLNEEVAAKLQFTEAEQVPEAAVEAAATLEAVIPALPKDRWMDVLLALGGIFVAFTGLAIWLKQPVWIYAALISGGFVGPVSFVAYMRSSQLLGFKPIRLAAVFAASGIIAVPVAWVLERFWSVGSGGDNDHRACAGSASDRRYRGNGQAACMLLLPSRPQAAFPDGCRSIRSCGRHGLCRC